jgi:hypothetical protein
MAYLAYRNFSQSGEQKMSEEENVLQPVSESFPQLTDALKSTKEAVRQLNWAYKEGMREFNHAVILAYCPVDNLEDFTLDHNLNPHDPRAAQFMEKFRERLARAALMLKDCESEPPRA